MTVRARPLRRVSGFRRAFLRWSFHRDLRANYLLPMEMTSLRRDKEGNPTVVPQRMHAPAAAPPSMEPPTKQQRVVDESAADLTASSCQPDAAAELLMSPPPAVVGIR